MHKSQLASDRTSCRSPLANQSKDGHLVTPELVASTSPYTRGHILRFGKYTLDMADLPSPLDPQPLPFEQPL